MLAKGDKIIALKSFYDIFEEGEIFEVHDVTNSVALFKSDNGGSGIMPIDFIEKFFEKYEEPKAEVPTVTEEMIDSLLENSAFDIKTIFNKCTIVSCKLPNGFVIVESSACVSPENYDEKVGVNICLEKIKSKLWELEGYRLQNELYFENLIGELLEDEDECSYNCDDCDDCSCDRECVYNN